MSKKPVALIDLDGTLADFHGAMGRDLLAMCAPGETPLLEHAHENLHPHIKARRDAIKRLPDWWFNLGKLESGFKIIDMLRDLKYRLHILTRGPKNLSAAWEQKVRWTRMYVPDASVTITLDKALVYGRVLIDDWPDYIIPWLQHRPRGLVIMPDHPWNKDFSHPQVLRHENNDMEVYLALQAHRDKK